MTTKNENVNYVKESIMQHIGKRKTNSGSDNAFLEDTVHVSEITEEEPQEKRVKMSSPVISFTSPDVPKTFVPPEQSELRRKPSSGEITVPVCLCSDTGHTPLKITVTHDTSHTVSDIIKPVIPVISDVSTAKQPDFISEEKTVVNIITEHSESSGSHVDLSLVDSKLIADCFAHPSVIETVAKVLLNRINAADT